MKRFSYLMALMLLSGSVLGKDGFPVRVSLFNEATAIPYTRLLTRPLHPGIQLGTEATYCLRQRFHLYQAFQLGYLYHNHLYQGAYLGTELGYDARFGFGLNLKALLGVGYLHTFTTQQEYQFRNGRYESRADRGNNRVMPSLSLGLGYRLRPKQDRSPEVFALYQSWLEYPYSPGFIPVMAHVSLHLGIKFFL